MLSLPIVHVAVVDSTQAFLARHPELGYCGVLADAQSAGHGRNGNDWESAPGAGLWLSAALPLPPIAPGLLLQRAMLAAIHVLKPCGVPLGLKWPNDLVAKSTKGQANHPLVKVGGILGDIKGPRLLLGLGVNLTAAPHLPDRPIPATSLAELGAVTLPSPLTLAHDLLKAWQALDIPHVPAFRWPEVGEWVTWRTGEGQCKAWLADGRLSVQTQAGPMTLACEEIGLGLEHKR